MDEINIGEQVFVLNVDDTMEALLRQEDLNKDGLITVDDNGPKVEEACDTLRAANLTA